ncbi:hypothetical protein RHS01_07674 [Rhizoctonia solani]|uniref:RNA-directed DNA polymerase n=1 Tax=Rhizoctonia solani TaxID=456999 RepID=A0A8H7LZL0_9AGAM|nr:hypothetical protein RHS01_07674 [Rhizoctonia solani]
MSRRLRSGRNYDASKVPTAPKRRADKRMAPKTANRVEPETSNKTTDEQAIRAWRAHGSAGVGKRQGIAFADTEGVKLSPSAYVALTQRAPPIRKVLSWPLPIKETRREADAPMNREATSEQSVELVERASVEQTSAPAYADDQRATSEVPTTPNIGAESRRESDDEIFVTARTSRVLNESIVLDDDGKPVLAQYIVIDEKESETPSKNSKRKRTRRKSKGKGKEKELDISVSTESKSTANHEGLTWDEEVRRANGDDGGPGDVEELPDVSDWEIATEAESGNGSVEVNALIYELADEYAFDDEEYASVLRNLRSSERSESTHSQTRGAGPSRQPRVTIEEVDSGSEDTTTSRTRSHKSKGKAKAKAKGKKRKRPSLGAALDDLEGTRERHVRRTDPQSTPNAYRGGGYLEGIIESTPARKSSKTTRTDMGKASEPRREERRRERSTERRPPSPSESSESSETDSDETESTHTSRYGGGGPPDSSDSGSETADSSDSSWTESSARSRDDNRRNRRLEELVAKLKKQNKKLERKVVTQARSGYKAQSPKTYKGEADIDKLDMFIFSYDLYVSDTRLSDSKAVLTVSRFLDDKAASWYMLNVAPDPGSYSMESIYVGLYDYCFPPDFKDDMRKLYNEKKQGDSGVQDYFAELARLRRRLREVTDHQHVLRVWDGAAQYIKVGWALKGMRPEATTCETLRETALDIERAHKYKRSIEKSGNDKSGSRRNRSRSPSRKHDRASNYKNPGDNRSGGNRGDNKGTGYTVTAKGRDGQENQRRKLTDEKKAELRAAGLCFECERSGHLSKDCPNTPESKVRVSSVMLKELDELTRLKEKIEINAVGVGRKNKEPGPKHVERNAIKVKDHTRKVPNTLIVEAKLEGESVRVLLDSGCQTDMVSTTIVDQLRLPKVKLTKPLQVQLAMAGSRGTLHYGVKARIEYQGIDEYRDFDVGNLDNYDLILGTPFLFQHSVRLSFNPYGVYIGSTKSLPLDGEQVIQINSLSADIVGLRMAELRDMLRDEAANVCKPKDGNTPLPPFRAINHRIPLIDGQKTYRFRPSRCPEALKGQFESKAREYLGSGRWKHSTGSNAIPMLFIPKKKDGSIELRTVLDKREQNANTVKMASPLPLPEDILAEVSRHKYRTLLDGKDAYEQIRVVPEDVHKTLFHTPMGTMVSHVMQQGDCNAGATYQALMNHIFAPYIGVFMFVYLDDIVIFSDTLEEHVKHIRTILGVLKRERLFLSPSKMQFLAEELRILGHIVDEKGIRMDPHKVDSVSKWKTPESKEQLASFLGAVGYLAPNCPGIRIPMAPLAKRASGDTPFRWGGTEERAFRASGLVSQGEEWQTAQVAAFWSAKFTTAQQNYSVTDREALAVVCSLDKFGPLLHGVEFTILSDHKALEYLQTQKDLNPRQGSKNVLADALSRMYSEDKKGTERAESEFVPDYEEEDGIRDARGEREPDHVGRCPTEPGAQKSGPGSLRPGIPGRAGQRTRAPRNQGNERVKENWNPDIRDEFVGEQIAEEDSRETEPDKREETSPASVELEGGSRADNERDKWDPLDRSDHRQITTLVKELDVNEAIANGYQSDKDYARIVNEPSRFAQFELRDNLLYFTEHGRTYLCVPDTTVGEWHIRTLLISHAHSIVSHLGYKKTYAYMRESLYWKNMAKDVEKFCAACVSCASSKKSTQKPYGLLKPLPVPKYPWAQIGVDFLGPLTESATLLGKFDMAARVPEIIISDRDKLFTSIFWKTLYELLGTELRLSSAFHPQTDGQTERLIRTILALIRVCINPALRDWATKLPSIEFAVNSARSETTGFSPFALNYGRTPRPILVRTNTDMYGVRDAARNIKYALMIAHDAIIGSRISQMVEANRHRRPSPFKTDDLVYVSTKNMRVPLGKPHKLLAQWIGPVRIDGVVKEGATYHVELPDDLKRRGIKPIFHASLLKPHVPYEDRRFPGRNYKQIASLEADDDEWAVERIGGHRGKGITRWISRTKELPWKEDGEVPYDELSDSGSETLECASTRSFIITLDSIYKMYHGRRRRRSRDRERRRDAPPAYDPGPDERVDAGLLRLLNTVAQTSLETVRARNAPLPKGEGEDGSGGRTWPGPRMSGEVRWTCTKVLLASVPMGHCVHDRESGLTKGHLQEDALNGDALDLMLGIAADHLPEARRPPGLARDPPYEEEVPRPSTDEEREREENERVPDPVPTTLPDPVERGPANHPRRPATEPTQAGTIGRQVNELARKVSLAILSVENVISVTTTLSERVKRTHQRVIDREWDIMEDMSRIALRALRIEDEPRIGDANYPQELIRRASTGDGQGEQGDFETLRTVEAPESSIGEDEDEPSPGSDAGAEPAIVGDRDDPDVRDATDHVAKWTNLGPDIEMRDADKGLKTIEPEQPCISPRKLELKRSSTRRGSDRNDGKGGERTDGGKGRNHDEFPTQDNSGSARSSTNSPLPDPFDYLGGAGYEGGPVAKPLVELEMMRLSAELRGRPHWWIKYRNRSNLAKWKQEAIAQAEYMKESHIDYVLEELDGYAKLRDEATGLEVACYDTIWQSDTLIPPSLKNRLIDGVANLENVSKSEQDWPPRLNRQIFNLVNPSLYPIVYGRTLSYPEESEDRDPATLQVHLRPPHSWPGEDEYFVSKRFQWLPTDFQVSEDGKSTIEEIVAAYIPLFERVLTDAIPENDVIPERTDNDYYYDEHNYRAPPKFESFTDPSDYNWAYEEWKNGRPIVLPSVREGGYEPGLLEKRNIKYTLGGRIIQVIVKLTNIYLAQCGGRLWRVEGMKNEAIAVCGFYYYDEENVSEGRLLFRAAVEGPRHMNQAIREDAN